jgi:hypothetical protein
MCACGVKAASPAFFRLIVANLLKARSPPYEGGFLAQSRKAPHTFVSCGMDQHRDRKQELADHHFGGALIRCLLL